MYLNNNNNNNNNNNIIELGSILLMRSPNLYIYFIRNCSCP